MKDDEVPRCHACNEVYGCSEYLDAERARSANLIEALRYYADPDEPLEEDLGERAEDAIAAYEATE